MSMSYFLCESVCVLVVCVFALCASTGVTEDRQEEAEEVGNEAAADQWPLLYHLLVAVEKMLTAGVATPVDAYDTLWAALPRLMRHPHAWIRLLVCRLMGRCFALGEAEVRRRLLKEGYWFELIRQHTRLLEVRTQPFKVCVLQMCIHVISVSCVLCVLCVC